MSEPIETIKYKIISMRNQRMQENFDGILNLYENYLDWMVEFDAEEPKEDNDDNMGWEPIHNFYRAVVLKKSVHAIEMEFFDTKEKWKEADKDHWGVRIVRYGPNDIVTYFRSRAKAEDMFNKILKWWLA